MAVLLAGCRGCGRPAPQTAEMHRDGWLIVADSEGLSPVACPEHRGDFEHRVVADIPPRPRRPQPKRGWWEPQVVSAR